MKNKIAKKKTMLKKQQQQQQQELGSDYSPHCIITM